MINSALVSVLLFAKQNNNTYIFFTKKKGSDYWFLQQNKSMKEKCNCREEYEIKITVDWNTILILQR